MNGRRFMRARLGRRVPAVVAATVLGVSAVGTSPAAAAKDVIDAEFKQG